MLIGADFFLSHRVYVATSQHRLYFTYNGGAVFNLTASGKMPSETAAGTSELTDAAEYSRRGAAFAARRDFERALADLTRACELAPNDAGYFYQRGVIYLETRQTDPALADFNRALELKPDDVPALVARAELHLAGSDRDGASADLDAADRIASKEADVRLSLAHDYQRADLLVPAVAQLDMWILSHTDDARMADALYGRCWLRALQGQDLPKALNDCNSAFRMSSKSGNLVAQILNSRGLVRLRLGDYDKSIADYDASLKLYPKVAWSLYGRGVAKMRRNKAAEGEADIADAKKLWPKVADEFTRRGITP
jgi:tetratricopeptide (TPR) repeat protein